MSEKNFPFFLGEGNKVGGCQDPYAYYDAYLPLSLSLT